MGRTRFQAILVAVPMLCALGLAAASIVAADGRLIYTLDDPYIHLALAQSILNGGFGVNQGEWASPSSSMAYAPLLALTLLAGMGTAGPLVLALAAMGAALWLLAGLAWDTLDETPAAPLPLATTGMLALVLALAVNGLALPMTGMEHTLHLWASLAVVTGLARIGGQDAGRAPVWLPLAILACAAIRFEGFALALAAIGVLALNGLWRPAAAAALLVGLLAAGWVLAMQAMGLPVLPSSVMVKSGVAAAAVDADRASLLGRAALGVLDGANNRWGLLIALCAVATLAGLVLIPQTRGARMAAQAGLAALAAHLAFGQYGWFGRYEVYAVGIALAVVALTLGSAWRRAGTLPVRAGLTVLLLACIALPSLRLTMMTPSAARNIFEQQYQMHRFATGFFPRGVAVNDLGYVAFDNPAHVLDLWGLGSETARRMTADGGRSVQMLRTLTGQQGTAYAMIYDDWFAGAVPPEWCRIAALRTSRVTAASDTVAFYLIDTRAEAEMRAALDAFVPTLPPGAAITVTACPDR